MKRLVLGLVLIGLAATVLLVSDWNQRQERRGSMSRVALVQHASQAILDESVQGMLAGLAENGLIDGRNMQVQRFNPQADMATANAIAKEITQGQFDLLLTCTTLSLQTVANANRAGRTRHVFGIVADPYSAGVGIKRENPADHPKHLTGIGMMPPVENTFRMAKKMFPALRRVGVAWNPAESNSEACTRLARKVSAELGIGLVEANVENSSMVGEVTESLVGRGVQALWVGGDVAVVLALDQVVSAARRGRIPVFTSVPGNTKRGSLFDLGANFFEAGRRVGALAAQVLKGADPAKIPVKNEAVERLGLNQAALEGLKEPWSFPADLVARAAKDGDQPPLAKKWKIHFIQLNNVLDVEESEQGVREGMKAAGLVEGRDYEVKVRNAQGDMATVNGLVDSALAEGADLLVTFSTPTLQVAIQRTGRVPIVFTYVASGVLAGAGKTSQDHRPNVTGVDLVGAYDDMIGVMRQCLPRVKRVGTLFVPAEVNMVYNKDKLVEEAKKAGIEVVPMAVSTSSEVSDAALAMVSKGIDAVCQIGGNLTASAFSGIAQAARKGKVPVFAFQKVQAQGGAMVVLARDYHDAGRESGQMAARIMRGESPAKIPFQTFTKTHLIVNLEAARALGITLPEGLVKRATEAMGR